MERDKKYLNIVALFENAFPIAEAASNRLISIAKGINELGHHIVVYCIRPSERPPNIVNKDIYGIIEGVEYFYPAKTTIWPHKKSSRIIMLAKGIFTTWSVISKSHNDVKIDIVLSYTYSAFTNTIFWFFTRIYKIKFVYLIDEYPYSILYPQKNNFLFKWYDFNLSVKLFDFILVISNPLHKFYNARKKKRAGIEVIQMTVQPERFEQFDGESPNNKPYFAYAGFLGENKDGVDILIEAFGKVANVHKDVLLYIIGYSNKKSDHDYLIELAKIHKVENRIIFTGKIHRNDIPRYFCNAMCLVLARPDNIQAKGGFPTKLGEYLATGKPVIVTKVGEIPFYLKDNENAFLAEPGSSDSFAHKMIEVIEDPIKAELIGLNGKRLTKEVFNYRVQAERIIKILDNSFD